MYRHFWKNGNWFNLSKCDHFYLMCCDCGLVHKVTMQIKGNKIKMDRDEGETEKWRKKKKIALCTGTGMNYF